jgi:hypothetical protein
MTDALTERQRQYVQHLARGMNSRKAALAAGYSASFSRVAAHRLGKKPEVARAIAAIRTEGMLIAVYDLATAMAEAEDVCAFAKKHRNAMAYCKGTEVRSKLSGLLIDRVEVATIDLRGALEKAEIRVLTAITMTNGASSAVGRLPLPAGSTRWRPPIPGDPEDPEAGPAEGESVS